MVSPPPVFPLIKMGAKEEETREKERCQSCLRNFRLFSRDTLFLPHFHLYRIASRFWRPLSFPLHWETERSHYVIENVNVLIASPLPSPNVASAAAVAAAGATAAAAAAAVARGAGAKGQEEQTQESRK